MAPNQPKPTKTRPNQLESNQLKPTKTRPNQLKPTKTRPNQLKPTKTRPNQLESNQLESSKTKSNKTKPNKTKPNKTKPTDATVESYLETIADQDRRKDCMALAKLMAKVTKHEPKMWGPSIVGFGSYHYKYDSGREGESMLTGFSSRKGDISVYLMGNFPERDELLAQLGKHKTAKACLYVRKFADVDAKVLERLVAASVAAVKDRYGFTGSG